MNYENLVVALPYNSVSDSEKRENGRGILTSRQENQIADAINRSINIPFVSEKREKKIFLAGVRLVEKALEMYLPDDLLKCINEITDGVTNEEVATLERRMTPMINRMINIPIIPEFLEARLIKTVLGIILNAMRKGSKL